MTTKPPARSKPVRRRGAPGTGSRPEESGELGALKRRLAEAEDALRAIREGEVDAVIVSGSKGERVFSLSESESIYRLMVETMSEAGLAVTPEGTILFANNCFAKMIGLPPEQVVGKPLTRFIGRDSRRKLNSLLDKARSGPSEARLVLEPEGGASLPVHVWANLLDRPDGPMICLVGVDLSQLETSKEIIQHLQEQRQALAESERKYRLLFENMAEGFALYEMLFDERGQPAGWQVLEVNDAYLRQMGLTKEQVFGRPANEIPTEEIAEYLPFFARVVAAQAPVEFETYSRSAGRYLYCFVFPAGQNRFACTIADITERRKAEQVLRRSAEELEMLVQHRTVEIKKKDDLIRRAQKIEALGTLAGGIAHDFNNVLSTIMINAELAILEGPAAADGQGPLPLVLQAVRRGQELVKQIIAFSRQKEQERKLLRVSPIIEDSLRFLRSSLPTAIEIRERLADSADTVLADPSQIHQIVMNLCVNAAHAMRERGGILEVDLKAVDIEPGTSAKPSELQPGPYVNLVVSDTGTGMSPDVMERVFDPFFTTKAPGEGSGLGLSVVHGIVKGYGGEILVSSEPGRGSAFSVFLPRVHTEPAKALARPEILRGSGERILLVEDEEVQLQSLSAMLERLGYAVTGRMEGAEALALFEVQPLDFDLIITDQTMPKMSGGRFAEAVLRIRPGMPIVLCTGFSEMIDAPKARQIGIREFLYKPFTLGEISQVIRRALQAPGAAAGA